MKPRSLLSKMLYQRRRFTIGWFIGMFAVTVLTLSFFPTFKNGDLGKAFDSLSPSLQKIAGNAASFKSIGGYIDQQIFALRIPLLATVLSIILLYSLSVGEEKKGILETQLSMPLSRSKILRDKLLAATAITAIAAAGVILAIEIMLVILGEHYALGSVVKATAGAFLVGFDFGLLAFMLGSAFGSRGMSVGIASGLAFLSYLITSLVAAVPSLSTVEKFSLFHYQNPSHLSLNDALLLLAVAAAMCLVSFLGFLRRDVGK